MRESLILRGDICFTPSADNLTVIRGGYLCVQGGIVKCASPVLPEPFRDVPVEDCGDALIIPGMTDLHLHAPQYSFCGLGMDLELLEWLAVHTYPEETRYRDESYAEAAYGEFVKKLRRSETTRAVIFATVHVPATLRLMEQLEESGLCAFVGKVNMDRSGPEDLIEPSAEESLRQTRRWLEASLGRWEHVKPVLTPRFTPSCSDELMRGLGELRREYCVPVQSHLSENQREIALVKELCPWSSCYADTYDRAGLLEGAVMAHCVSSPEEEVRLLKDRRVMIAHCPQSNTNIASGIAPVRRYLDEGMRIGLGTDVAGGANLSMFRAVTDAIGVSKLRWRLADQESQPLKFEEAFWMATKGGGSWFGRVGSFEPGYEADILVVRERNPVNRNPLLRQYSPRERLERLIYLPEESPVIEAKYVCGRRLF